MKLQQMLQLMPTPGDQNLLKWMERAMKLIDHDDGTQPVDRILANALQQKLKEAGRPQDAEAISAEFADDDTKWVDIVKRLALMYPKSELDNTNIVDKFNREYLWHKMSPMKATLKCLRDMDIPKTQAPKENSDSKRLFRILRSKIPEGIRLGMRGKEAEPWDETPDYIQEYWNAEKGDQLAAGAVKAENNTYPDSTPKTFAAPAQPVYQPPNPLPIHVTVNSPPQNFPAPVYVTTAAPAQNTAPRYATRFQGNKRPNTFSRRQGPPPRTAQPTPLQAAQQRPAPTRGPRNDSNNQQTRYQQNDRTRARSLPPRNNSASNKGNYQQGRERATPSSSEEAQ